MNSEFQVTDHGFLVSGTWILDSTRNNFLHSGLHTPKFPGFLIGMSNMGRMYDTVQKYPENFNLIIHISADLDRLADTLPTVK